MRSQCRFRRAPPQRGIQKSPNDTPPAGGLVGNTPPKRGMEISGNPIRVLGNLIWDHLRPPTKLIIDHADQMKHLYQEWLEISQPK
jgi:hypothetical protein